MPVAAAGCRSLLAESIPFTAHCLQLGKEKGQDLSVCVIEKGAEVGELRLVDCPDAPLALPWLFRGPLRSPPLYFPSLLGLGSS